MRYSLSPVHKGHKSSMGSFELSTQFQFLTKTYSTHICFYVVVAVKNIPQINAAELTVFGWIKVRIHFSYVDPTGNHRTKLQQTKIFLHTKFHREIFDKAREHILNSTGFSASLLELKKGAFGFSTKRNFILLTFVLLRKAGHS